MIGVIGGSGFEKFDGFRVIRELERDTPFGRASSGLSEVELDGKKLLFVPRHGRSHELTPTEVNYRANIYTLKKHGARAVVAYSAVGSLAEELSPGSLAITTQYLDRTKGIRASTYCGDGVVGHVSHADPVCGGSQKELKGLVKDVGFKTFFDKTYVCIEGPGFSTRAESNWYRTMGAEIVGMTHCPEHHLAREAGLSYLPCCFVTDYDCWDESIPHVTLGEVLEVMRANNQRAFDLLKIIAANEGAIWKDCPCAAQGLRTGLMTPMEAIPEDKKAWLEVLMA